MRRNEGDCLRSFWQQGRVLKAVVEPWMDEMPKSALPSPNEGGLGKRLSDVVRELLLQAEHPSSVALAQMLRHSTSVPTPVLERWRQRRSLQRRVLTTCSTRTSATWPRAGKKALSKERTGQSTAHLARCSKLHVPYLRGAKRLAWPTLPCAPGRDAASAVQRFDGGKRPRAGAGRNDADADGVCAVSTMPFRFRPAGDAFVWLSNAWENLY